MRPLYSGIVKTTVTEYMESEKAKHRELYAEIDYLDEAQ